MRIKATLIIIISIINIIGGIILNFSELINDYMPVTFKNVIVTFVYIVIWILVLRIGIKNRYIRIIKMYSAFWIITLILAIMTIFINSTGINAGGAIPLVILFLSQWYGLRFFIGSFMIISSIISIISLLILTYSIFLFKQTKQT